jgi:hypothetical protein
MTARITFNVVRDNVADDLLNNGEGGSGGGIFVNADGVALTPGLCNQPGGQAEVTISNNVVRLNTARNLDNPDDTDSFATGGGIAIEPITASSAPIGGQFPTPVEEWQVDVLVSGNTVTDNTVQAGDGLALGGGIATASSGPGLETLTLENNTVGPGNLAVSSISLGFGGGISITDEPFRFCLHEITADGNVITGNSADIGGGLDLLVISEEIEADQRLVLTASNNRIENNSATREGGGLSMEFNSLQSLDVADAALFSPPVVDFLAEEISFTIRGNILKDNTSDAVGGGAVFLIDADADHLSDPPLTCFTPRPAVAQIDFFGNLVQGNSADNVLVLDLGSHPVGDAGCSDAVCEAAVCDVNVDPFCCDDLAGEWDLLCAEEAANEFPASCDCESSDCCGTVVIGSGLLFSAQARGEALAGASIGNSTIVDNSILTNGGLVGGVEIDGITLADCNVQNTGRITMNVDRSILADNDGYGLGGPDPGANDVTPTVTNTFAFDNGVAGGANQYQITLFPTDPPGNFSDDPLLDPVTFVPGLCSPVYDVAGFCEDDPGNGCLVNDDCLPFGNPSCVSVGAGFLASPDINQDNAVDGVDLLRFSTGFGAEDNVDQRYLPGADLDRNGMIDGIDLMFIAPLFAQECVQP